MLQSSTFGRGRSYPDRLLWATAGRGGARCAASPNALRLSVMIFTHRNDPCPKSDEGLTSRGRAKTGPAAIGTLTSRDPSREPNRQTFWFGAELDPDGSHVWFRIASEAVRRMGEQTPRARGDRLVDALLAWLMTPDRRQLEPDLNRFQVLVSDDGDTTIERYGD